MPRPRQSETGAHGTFKKPAPSGVGFFHGPFRFAGLPRKASRFSAGDAAARNPLTFRRVSVAKARGLRFGLAGDHEPRGAPLARVEQIGNSSPGRARSGAGRARRLHSSCSCACVLFKRVFRQSTGSCSGDRLESIGPSAASGHRSSGPMVQPRLRSVSRTRNAHNSRARSKKGE